MQQTEVSTILVEPASKELESSEQEVALSIVVPMMNEEQSVRPVFEKLWEQLNSSGQRYEVIFVDDGSTALVVDRSHFAVGDEGDIPFGKGGEQGPGGLR